MTSDPPSKHFAQHDTYFLYCFYHEYSPGTYLFDDIFANLHGPDARFSFKQLIIFLCLPNFIFHLEKQLQPVIKVFQSQWLLNHCQPKNLFGLDRNAVQQYFFLLEKDAFHSYLESWPQRQDWLKNQFESLRFKMWRLGLKRYGLGLLFFVFIFLIALLGFHTAAKDTTFTIWEQIKGWLQFLFQKL